MPNRTSLTFSNRGTKTEVGNDSPNLDFLRAFAVLTVYLGHLLQVFRVEQVVGLLTIYDLAQTGVLMFFVHTSLVLLLSLDRLSEATPTRLFQVFYIRRIFRIYPLSIVTVLLMFLAGAPDFPGHPFSRPGSLVLLSNLSLTQNLTRTGSYPAVLWSLPFEVQMYLVLPFLFVILCRFSSWMVPVFLWVLSVTLILLISTAGIRGVPGILQYVPCFLGGAITYRLWKVRRRGWHFIGWPLVIVACVGLRVLAQRTPIPHAPEIYMWVTCLILGFAAPQFREPKPRWLRVGSALVARYSYGIYLSHTVVFWITFTLMQDRTVATRVVVCVALSALFPLGMYHLVEKPMIHLGMRLSRRCATGTAP